jgi:ornithine cyclodeaminase
MTTVPFLDVAAAATWVARRGPEAVIADLTDALERDVARWEELEKRPRLASHSTDGVIELMPASDAVTYGFKFVNGHPLNPGRGYQTVTAFGVLADVHNGYPTFLAEMTLLTALRTAATSALAARHLARRDSRTMALVGTGSQAEFQALGMRAALGIGQLAAWDVDADALAKFVRNARELGFEVRVARSAADAVEGADVVTTCTADKTNATVLTDDMVRHLAAPGVHLNAIGGDCPGKTELDLRIVERASVFVEYAPQTRIEGEIQLLPADFPVTELWEVVTGRRPGRRSADELTLWDSVGFAVEDWSVLRYVHEDVATSDPDLLQHLDLVAEPEDPKDLFALVRSAQTTAPAHWRARVPVTHPA